MYPGWTACGAQPAASPTPAQVPAPVGPRPGGTFTMGSPAGNVGRDEDEGPTVEAQVEPF
jgi:formylglycine-generating enzyme required for sulfatase activity